MQDALVDAVGITKTYATGRVRVEALRGVDVTVARGEMLAIMGPSGGGKTTLLHCLSGLDDVDGGSIRIAEHDLATLSDDERTRLRAERMGFVFQSFNLVPVLTAAENVELPLLVTGFPGRKARARALAALARVDLADRADHRPKELSGGQQQRVAIARSLVNDPVIVWADEPTGNLDTRTGEDVFQLMLEMNRTRGQTYVVVTHDPRIADRCHRVLHLESGRIVEEA